MTDPVLSQCFPSLSGNADARLRLARNIREGTLPHAILIAGKRGSGKHTLALQIAASLNCEKAKEEGVPLPCGSCNSCRRVLARNHPDVCFLAKQDGKATVGVEEMRLFREDMFLSPTESDKKIYIIEDAEDMTPAGQNALLKVLEEPPAGVHILLLSESTDKLLTTVRSRAQLIRMQRFTESEIGDYLCAHHREAVLLKDTAYESYRSLLLFADGRIGLGKELLDREKLEEHEAEQKLVKNLVAALSGRAPYEKLYTAVFALPQKREALTAALERFQIALRDLILVGIADHVSPLFFSSREEAETTAGSIASKRLFAIYGITCRAIDDLGKNVMITTLLSDFAAKIKCSR